MKFAIRSLLTCTMGLSALIGTCRKAQSAFAEMPEYIGGHVPAAQSNGIQVMSENIQIGPPLSEWLPIKAQYSIQNSNNSNMSSTIVLPISSCLLNSSLRETIRGEYFDTGVCGRSFAGSALVTLGLKKTQGKLVRVYYRKNEKGEWVLADSKQIKILDRGFEEVAEALKLDTGTSESFTAAANQTEIVRKNICADLGGRISLDNYCPEMENYLVADALSLQIELGPQQRIDFTLDSKVPLESFETEEDSDDWKRALSQNRQSQFCVEDIALNSKRSTARSSQQFQVRWLYFILKSGINLESPVKNFKLTIIKGSAKDMISTCFKGLKKMSPLRFQFNALNYNLPKIWQLHFIKNQKETPISNRLLCPRSKTSDSSQSHDFDILDNHVRSEFKIPNNNTLK